MPQEVKKNCWSCGYNRLGGITLLGLCWYFYRVNKVAKEIPREICEKGCKFWTAEKQEFDVLKKPKILEEEL